MKKFPISVALILVVVITVGCMSTYGRKFDDSYVSQIKKGVTTKAQVREHLGEPWRVSITSSDYESWTYHYSDAYGKAVAKSRTLGILNEKAENQMLIVVYKGDTVASYTYSK